MSDEHEHSNKFIKRRTDISIVETFENTKKLKNQKTNYLPNYNHCGKTKHELRVQIHELRVQIHEFQVQIYEFQVQLHELQVQIHELED